MTSFYTLKEPTAWAAPPHPWSSTTLDEVEACPRRWQLLRSRWGEHERFPVRPHPAAIEGQIVHEALDRLTRACGKRGNPAPGSALFAEAIAEADFFTGFARAVADWQASLAHHPRPGPPFQLRVNPQELANHAVRLFREQYRPVPGTDARTVEKAPEQPVDLGALLRRKSALSEVRLRHPKLPFIGVLDRVSRAGDGVEVVDFKTGRTRETHRRQLLRYAVLWWRATGDVPVRVCAQYLDGVQTWNVETSTVEAAEEDLKAQLAVLTAILKAQPAAAVPGAGCRTCPVRARCADGWTRAEEDARAAARVDVELIVVSVPGRHGFLARDTASIEVSVVHETAVAPLVPAVGVGQVIRVVDGVWREKGKELEIKAWTEVYAD